ncbi:chitin-binding type-2 domain-containing protein [Trichonephila clavipes]|nr:chitin-binding type-2 domain-containing protein [Trichonephila clavipes]
MLDHLEDNIRRVIADIRPQMLEKVIENWTSRLDYIRASRGSPMPEIIFKILSSVLQWVDKGVPSLRRDLSTGTSLQIYHLIGTSAHAPQQPMCQAKKIRGIPEVDYPTYYVIPKTSFRCSDQLYNPGFYADVETRCQVFHYCYEHRQESFLCPLGTIFNQPILSCDYWYSSDCSKASEYYHVNMNNVHDEDDADLGMIINPLEDQSSNVFDKMKHLYEEETKTSDTSIPFDDFNNFKKKPSDKLEDLTEESLGESLFSRVHYNYENEENNMDLNVTPDMPFKTGDEKHPKLVRYKIKKSNELNVYEGYENEDYDEDEADANLVLYDDGMLHINENSVQSRSETLDEMPPSDHDTNADIDATSSDTSESKIKESIGSELHKRVSEDNLNFITKRPPRRKPIFVIKEQEVKPVALPVQIVKPKRRPIKIGMDSAVKPSIPNESTDSLNIDEATAASAEILDHNIASSGILGDDSGVDSEQDFALFDELNEKSSDKILDETLMLRFIENENIEQRKKDNETTDDENHDNFSGEEDTEIGIILPNFEENEASSHMGSGDDLDHTESISVFETENPVFLEESDYLTNSRGTSEILDETNPENFAANDFLDHTELTNENEYGSDEDIDMALSTENVEDVSNFVNEYNELGDYIYLTPDELQKLQKNSFEEISAIPDQVADGEAETFYYYLPDSESESNYPFDHSNGIYPEGMNYNINENLEAEMNDDSVDVENIDVQVDSNETMINVPTYELEDRRVETSEEQIEKDLSEAMAIKSKMRLNHDCKGSQNLCLKNSKDASENLSNNFPDSNVEISETFPQTFAKNPRRKYKVIYEEDEYENLTPEDIKFLEIMAEASSLSPELPAETSHQLLDRNPDSIALEESEVLHTEIPFNYKNTEKEPIKFNEIDHTELDNSLDIGKHKVNEVFEHGSKILDSELNIKQEKRLNIKDSDQVVFPEHETLISPELAKNEKLLTQDTGFAILTDSKSKNVNEIPFENIGYKQNLPTKPIKSTQKNPVKIPVSKQNVQKLAKNELKRKPRASDLQIPINFNPVSAPDLGIVAQKLSYIPTTFLKFKHSILKPYFSESYYDRDFESSQFFARSGYISEPSKLSKVLEFGKKLLRAKRAKLKIIRKFAERFGRNFYDLSS